MARETDRALATGEALSAALFALGLQARGIPARSFSGAEAGIRTAAAHLGAEVRRVLSRPLRAAIGEGLVPVVAGFQGIGTHGELDHARAGRDRPVGGGVGRRPAGGPLRAVQGRRRRARGRSASRARGPLPAGGRRPPARAAGRDGRRGGPPRGRATGAARPAARWWCVRSTMRRRRRSCGPRHATSEGVLMLAVDRKERMARISLVGPAALDSRGAAAARRMARDRSTRAGCEWCGPRCRWRRPRRPPRRCTPPSWEAERGQILGRFERVFERQAAGIGEQGGWPVRAASPPTDGRSAAARSSRGHDGQRRAAE